MLGIWIGVCCWSVNGLAERITEREPNVGSDSVAEHRQDLENRSQEGESLQEPDLPAAVDVLTAKITDVITMDASRYLQAVLQQAQARGVEDVVLALDAKQGSYEVAVEMMQQLDAFPGRVHAYVAQEAIGPAALVLLACDKVYVRKSAIIGDASVYDEGSSDQKTELRDPLQARARSYAADLPFRADLMRAIVERDFQWTVGDQVLKSPGKFLILTGKEAAALYPYDDTSAPLLASGIYADVPAVLAGVFAGKQIADFVAAQSNLATDEDTVAEAVTQADAGAAKADVFIVPIEGPIDTPQLYILRRALKEAIANDVEVVVLDMDTPGGRMDVMFEMMEALDRFEGTTITYIDEAAISAGSYIAIASNEIYFAPQGVMGAAAAIQGSGEDIPPTLKAKIDSITQAKVRALTAEHPYRADVLRAMSDASFEFKLDGRILSPKGELLSLTAEEAAREYGYPPRPLVSSGTRTSVDELLDKRFGADQYTIKAFAVTWSERFAKWFKTIAPVLMGVGMLLLFIEFKTPNFGIIGGIGIGLVMLVFASNYFAGMAGYEPILVFALGVVLIAVELFLLPGTLIFGATGLLMILGSLLWALADIWPSGDGGIQWDPGMFYGPALQLAMGLVITFVGLALVWRYLPNTWIWRQMVLDGAAGGSEPKASEAAVESDRGDKPAIGSRGIAATDMFPSGEVEIAGRRYQARAKTGSIEKAADIEVVQYGSFGLVVAKVGG